MNKLLAARIRQARKNAGLSQSQLAGKIGAHVTSVSDWERGRNAPSARHLLSIAEATGTEINHFMARGKGDPEEEDADPVLTLTQAIRAFVRAEARAVRDEAAV
jgi:transcriptional regulator with XRE-family HTH domain